MIELLLAAQLSCSDGYWILDGIENSSMSDVNKAETKIEVRAAMPDYCHREHDETRPRRS